MSITRCILGLVVLPLLVAPPAGAQSRIAGGLSTVKVGRWIQLEGTLQKDQTALCSELKILTGDFLNDDWSIRGPVRAVDIAGKRFQIERFWIVVPADAEFDDDLQEVKKLEDLRTGMVVEVEGTYLKDRTFLAKEIENQSARVKTKPQLSKKIQIVGKAERVDTDGRSITAMGTTFLINDRTQIKSVIK